MLFGTPVGATIFALEVVHRRGLEYYEALVPALLGGLCGYAVFVVGTSLGVRPVWDFTPLGSPLVVSGMSGLSMLPSALIGSIVSLGLSRRVNVIESQRSREAEEEEQRVEEQREAIRPASPEDDEAAGGTSDEDPGDHPDASNGSAA